MAPDTTAAIRRAINSLGEANSGQGSVTGIRALLAGEGVMVSTDEIYEVGGQDGLGAGLLDRVVFCEFKFVGVARWGEKGFMRQLPSAALSGS